MVHQVKQTVQGGDWTKVQEWFVARYGSGKLSSIKRMVLGAKCLTPELLEFIADRALRKGAAHGRLPSFFLQNEFFCGTDPRKATQRLVKEEQLYAARVMASILDDDKSVTSQIFQEQVRSFLISSFLHFLIPSFLCSIIASVLYFFISPFLHYHPRAPSHFRCAAP